MGKQIEVTRKHNILAKDWVCCPDCGFLIKERKDGEAQWEICSACLRVYSENDNKWIAKMLAKRVNNIDKILSWFDAIKKNNIYKCKTCSNFYLGLYGVNNGDECYWCFLLKSRDKKTKVSFLPRKDCAICHKKVEKEDSLLCVSCAEKLQTVKGGVEYSRYIKWFGRYMRASMHKVGVDRKLIKVREDLK